MKKRNGFSLIEIILGIVVIMAGILAMYAVLGPSQTNAAVRQEQDNAQKIADSIMGAYSAASDYSTLSTATAAGVMNVSLDSSGAFNSAFKNPLTVRPATTRVANDSFELVYSGLTSKECTGLASAMKSKTQGIYIGSNASVQALDGTVSDESAIAAQCAGLASTDTVALRFYNDKTTFAATTVDACTCAPQTDTQTLACASGQVGSVTQRRTATCTGGTPSCPSQVWSSWVTSSNTCGQIGAPVAPVTPVTPSAVCVPKVETRQGACPSGQVGALLQQRTTDCTTGTWGAWVNVGGSCATTPVTTPVTTACTPQVGPVLSEACPAGQGGQVLSQRSATCDSAGNLVWGAPQVVSSSCTASCVASGTCCKPRKEKRSPVVEYNCAQGSYGYSTVTQFLNYTCASPTATPTAWSRGWTNDESTRVYYCTTCPADTMKVDPPRWVPRSSSCPSGQTGENTWEAEQVRTETTTYNCNHAANTTSPTSTVTTGTWTDTGNTRNRVSTCAPNAGPSCTWVLDSTLTPPNFGQLDGASVVYNDGLGGGCRAGWGVHGDPGDQTLYETCVSSIPRQPLSPGADYSLSEYSNSYGYVEVNNTYVASCAPAQTGGTWVATKSCDSRYDANSDYDSCSQEEWASGLIYGYPDGSNLCDSFYDFNWPGSAHRTCVTEVISDYRTTPCTVGSTAIWLRLARYDGGSQSGNMYDFNLGTERNLVFYTCQ